jgi:hypothetical protein
LASVELRGGREHEGENMSERTTLPRFHLTKQDAVRPLAVLVDN